MSVQDRLIRYCQIDTQSDPKSTTSPSTMKQFDLAKVLLKELQDLGVQDAELDEYCNVYAHLESNLNTPCKTVGFIAHMDTAPDYSGANVHPRIIENYDGEDITLCEGVITKVEDFPYLKTLKGKTLMVTDGSTLLGADDKAGIACIMETVQYYMEHPEVKHGRIAIAFTPDEEVDRGTEHFNIEKFGANFAYTMDGDRVDVWSDETFNAASAVVTCTGFSIHPGSAKDRMINALNTAIEFHNTLPEHMRPEHTCNREPFFHLCKMQGNVDTATMEYIIRAHETADFERMKKMMKTSEAAINEAHGQEVIHVDIQDGYHNMKEILLQHPEVSSIAETALKELGLQPVNESIRGGTDGAELTFRGLPCPNLGNGGGNFHGRYEYCVMEELELACKLVEKIAELVAKGE